MQKYRTTYLHSILCQAIAATVFVAGSSSVFAQDAGSILRENTQPSMRPWQEPSTLPAAPVPPSSAQGVRFVLQAVRFEGNSVLPEADLQAFAAKLIGQAVGFVELEDLAARITEHYHSLGYFLASVILQRQDVTNGIVTLTVVEGKLSKIQVEVDPQAPISKERVQAMLAAVPLGQAANQAQLEHAILLLSDLPGITVTAQVEAGLEAGTSDLLIEVKAKRRWELQVTADNHGSPSTGEARLNAIVRINSPLGIGDNLDLRALRSENDGLELARLGYELPLGVYGTRLSFGYTTMHYDLIGKFRPLRAHGSADVWEVGLSHPFIRSRQTNLLGHLSFEHKKLRDNIKVADWQSRKTVNNLVAGMNYEARDSFSGGGYTNASLYATVGNLRIRPPQLRAEDADAVAGQHTHGDFTRFNYRLTRLQRLYGNLFAYAGLEGQQANKNLGSSEKMLLGGPNAVRGYSANEAPVDEGHLINAELRYALPHDLTALTFYDWGKGKQAQDPLAAMSGNTITLRSYGLGLNYSNRSGFSAKATVGWRDGSYHPTVKPDREPWFYVHTSMNF